MSLHHVAVDQHGVHKHRVARFDDGTDWVVEGLHAPGIGPHQDYVGGLPRGQGSNLVA